MNGKTYETIKFTVQSISVVLSVIINALLIYLILTKSPKKMGTYRHLMIYFCCFSIFFSTMDILVQPNIHTYKSAFIMVMDYKNRGFNERIAEFLTCAMCGCFGVTIYGIAVHFIYRYFALERQGRLRYFREKLLPLWLLIPVSGGISWFMVSFTVFSMDSIKADYIRETIKEFFDLEIDSAVFVSAVMYPLDANGVPYIYWKSVIGFVLFMSIMLIPFIVVLVVGWKSRKKIRELINSGESLYTRNLQMQLYKALVAQTVIPLLLLFIPFGIIFVLPVFEINCQFMTAPITFGYAIYPAVDPLPIFYFVDNYRNAVSDTICPYICKKNRIGVSDDYVQEGTSRNQHTV